MGNTYRKLKVWNKAVDLAVQVYGFTGEFPKQEIYGLSSQMGRHAGARDRREPECAQWAGDSDRATGATQGGALLRQPAAVAGGAGGDGAHRPEPREEI